MRELDGSVPFRLRVFAQPHASRRTLARFLLHDARLPSKTGRRPPVGPQRRQRVLV